MERRSIRQVGPILGACAAVILAAGSAAAQSAPREGFDRPLGASQGDGKSKGTTELRSATRDGKKEHVQIQRSDASGEYMLIFQNGEISAKINGERVPKERIEREGDEVRLLTERGDVLTRFYIQENPGRVRAESGQTQSHVFRLGAPQARAEGDGAAALGRTGGEPPVMLGITMSAPSKELREHFGLREDEGVRIASVIKDLPADRAGVQEGDIVIAIDGNRGATEQSLRDALRSKSPGDKVALRVLRKGSEKEVTVRLERYDPGRLNIMRVEPFGPGAEAGFPHPQVWTQSGLPYYGGTQTEARKALEEALRSLRESERAAGGAGREAQSAARRAIEEALRSLEQRRGFYAEVMPRGREEPLILDDRGQMFRVPAPEAREGGDRMQRELEALRREVEEIRRSRDDLREQLDDIRAMLREMRERDRR